MGIHSSVGSSVCTWKAKRVQRNANDGGLACEAAGRSKDSTVVFCVVFLLRMSDVWSAGAEDTAVINQNPVPME